MTREEAKKYLIDISYSIGNMSIEYLTEKDGDKMREAIETLWQEPCEDVISRTETVKFLANHSNEFEDAKIRIAFQSASSLVNNPYNLPPVQPQPKMGHWIFVDKAHEHAHCSECDYGDVDLMNGRPHNYCPNCGAKIQEVKE